MLVLSRTGRRIQCKLRKLQSLKGLKQNTVEDLIIRWTSPLLSHIVRQSGRQCMLECTPSSKKAGNVVSERTCNGKWECHRNLNFVELSSLDDEKILAAFKPRAVRPQDFRWWVDHFRQLAKLQNLTWKTNYSRKRFKKVSRTSMHHISCFALPCPWFGIVTRRVPCWLPTGYLPSFLKSHAGRVDSIKQL